MKGGEFLEHLSRNLAGIGARAVLAHVLRSQADVGVDDLFGDLSQSREGRADHHIHFLDLLHFPDQVLDQVQGLSHRLVHLPVAGNDKPSIFFHKID